MQHRSIGSNARHGIHERGLAVVNVGDDGDVANVGATHFEGSRFGFQGSAKQPPALPGDRQTNGLLLVGMQSNKSPGRAMAQPAADVP